MKVTLPIYVEKEIDAGQASFNLRPLFLEGPDAISRDLEQAERKLKTKKLDMIVANQVGGGKGFDSDQNAVNVYWKAGEQSFSTAEKTELARDVLKLIAERYEIEYSAGEYAIN